MTNSLALACGKMSWRVEPSVSQITVNSQMERALMMKAFADTIRRIDISSLLVDLKEREVRYHREGLTSKPCLKYQKRHHTERKRATRCEPVK